MITIYKTRQIAGLAGQEAGAVEKVFKRSYEQAAIHDQLNRWGAGVLVHSKNRNRFLLLKRGPDGRQPGKWAPAGGMGEDFDESRAAGGCRELFEEAMVQVSQKECTLMAADTSDDESNFTFYNFIASIDTEPAVTINEESAGFAWFTKDEMYELGDWLHPGFRAVIEGEGRDHIEMAIEG